MTATDDALLECITVLQTAVLGWFAPLSPAGGVHWGQLQKRVTPTLSIIPSSAGKPTRYIGGAAAWSGDIAIRAVGRTLTEAQTLMAQAAALVPAKVTASGYTITMQSIRPIMGSAGSATSGIVYQATIRPGG